MEKEDLRNKYPKKWVKSGMSVCDRLNPEVVMTVEKLLFDTKDIDGSKITHFNGVRCHYWGDHPITGSKALLTHDFHAKELIPAEIASQGKDVINKFLLRFTSYAN
jgi:hypothetical protein